MNKSQYSTNKPPLSLLDLCFLNLLGVPQDHHVRPSPASSKCLILVGDGEHFHEKYSSAGKGKADGMLMVVVKSFERFYTEYPAEGVSPAKCRAHAKES